MYHEEDYTEDIKLSKAFLAKYYPGLSKDEDVLSECVIKLWSKRADYDPAIAMYSTYAFKWLRQIISDYNKKRYAKKRQGETISIYTEISDGLILLDTLECEDNSKDNLVRDIVKIVYDKNKKLRPLIFYYLQGYKLNEIADKLRLTPVQASYCLRKLKKLCRQEYLLSEA